MARIIKPADARDLGLPGRISREIVSGETGGSDSVTLRLVEIPVEREGDPQRKPHSHSDCEECIHVISGEGVFCTSDGNTPLTQGDTVLVPPKELHYTRNTGSEPLMLLCFFPVADIGGHR